MKPAHVLAVIAFAAAAGAFAQAQPAAPSTAKVRPAAPLASGEVVSVSAKEKRVLLKHGPIANLGMSAMTMEFVVRDARLLRSVKEGDKVKFAAHQVADDYVITRIKVVK
jgi:Cu/Ag efflux protein CusF